jgi:hypothetical protein
VKGGAGSAAGRDFSAGAPVGEQIAGQLTIGERIVDEHCRRRPAEPLRRPSQWLTEEFRNVRAGAWLFEGG